MSSLYHYLIPIISYFSSLPKKVLPLLPSLPLYLKVSMEKSPNHNDPESSRSSTNSDQDVDQPTDYVAMGRSYECVFCKRGFTTAQALGGHMNIHRKDRAKNNRPLVGPVPTSLIHSNNHNSQINYHTSPLNRIYNHPGSGYGPPQPYNYYSHDAAHAYNYYSYDAVARHEPQHDSYRSYFPASTSDGGSRIPQFGDDWRMSLSLPFGGLAHGDGEEEKGGDEDDDELDLELRLGYNP